MITQHFQKTVLQIMMKVLEFCTKINVLGDWGLPQNFQSLPFPVGKLVAWKKLKTSNITGRMPPNFFILSPCYWGNNWQLNKINEMTLTSQHRWYIFTSANIEEFIFDHVQ